MTDTSSKKLADIAQVEFLNQMEDRIPAPQMNIPKNLTAEPGSREITVKWSRETNVTGYEAVSYTHLIHHGHGLPERVAGACIGTG